MILGIAVMGCGGGQEPAASPEVEPTPTPEPGGESVAPQGPDEGADAGAGEHTMPDGTKMPGSEHPEGSDHSGHQ